MPRPAEGNCPRRFDMGVISAIRKTHELIASHPRRYAKGKGCLPRRKLRLPCCLYRATGSLFPTARITPFLTAAYSTGLKARTWPNRSLPVPAFTVRKYVVAPSAQEQHARSGLRSSSVSPLASTNRYS